MHLVFFVKFFKFNLRLFFEKYEKVRATSTKYEGSKNAGTSTITKYERSERAVRGTNRSTRVKKSRYEVRIRPKSDFPITAREGGGGICRMDVMFLLEKSLFCINFKKISHYFLRCLILPKFNCWNNVHLEFYKNFLWVWRPDKGQLQKFCKIGAFFLWGESANLWMRYDICLFTGKNHFFVKIFYKLINILCGLPKFKFWKNFHLNF